MNKKDNLKYKYNNDNTNNKINNDTYKNILQQNIENKSDDSDNR